MKCFLCNHVLYRKYEGMVCKNFKCELYFKLGKGWVYLDGSKKNNSRFFKDKYDFDISRFENKKEWLLLKSKILHEKKCCEICNGDICLHIHHILPRSSNPELALDKENLMVLCERCHKKIHSKDKYKFS